MKSVQTLKTSNELVLAYATWLFALVGQCTVSNPKTKNLHNWWHISLDARKEFINGFYAVWNNYKYTASSVEKYR